LKDTVKLTAFSSNYQVFRQDRPQGNGGGILIAVKNDIPCKLVRSISVCGCECLFVDIQQCGSEFVRYCLVYRPPDIDLPNSLKLYDEIFQYLKNIKSYVLLGDFNLPDISWRELSAVSRIGKEFLTLCFKLGAEQLVDFPTRLDNQLDLILGPDRGMINFIQPEPPFCERDHISILCQMYNHKKVVENATGLKPCFKNAEYNLINAFLATIEWDVVFDNCSTTNDYWSAFKNIIDTAIYNFVPFVPPGKPKNVPWFTNKLRNLRSRKRRKWKKYVNSRNIVSYANYKSAAQQVRSEFIKAKCGYENDLFSNENTQGKFYGYIKSQMSVSTALPCIKRDDGSVAVSDLDKASEFSKYFSSVFVTDNNVMPEFHSVCNDRLRKFSCNPRDIVKVIMKLKSNSSPGPDGITSGFLKKVLAHIANPLCKVFQASLDEGVLPDDWKVAHIIPLYKKGDSQRTSQYRPVSVTPIICKVLERVIRVQLLNYLMENNIIPKCQHGFLPRKSTVSNLLECLDDWTSNFDKGISTDIIYLDYSKCFDKVCHSKLLYKLSKYGVDGSAFQWLQNFLTNRVQHVKINGTISPPVAVESGVPQGTVLGPLLFLCFSADLQNVVQFSRLSIYADDTKLYKGVQNVNDCHELQEDLNRVLAWAECWQMELNPEKTKLLTIGNNKFNYDYVLKGNTVDRVSHMNDVGVMVQSDLKFSKHCSTVIKKAYFVIKNIFNTFKYHNYDFYLRMYTCYVRPILEYGSQVWCPLLKTNIDKIERVQKYYTRCILKSFPPLSYMERLEFLKLQSLEERRFNADLILFYKKINCHISIDVEDSYCFVRTPRGHPLHMFKYYCRTDKRKHYWTQRIVNFWNGLHQEIVSSTSVLSFKKKLKCILFVGRGSIYCD